MKIIEHIKILCIFAAKLTIENMRIKEVIKEKGLTVKEVAAKMGVTQPSLSRAINENTTVEMLYRIASALCVPVTDLFEPPSTDVITCPKCGTRFRMEE